MLRQLWITLFVMTCAMLPTTSWGLCYYLVDQEGNVQSSIYPPYDLSYPIDQLSPAERAQRAQRGYLIIGDRVSTCSTQPFSPPKVAKAQPVDSNKKIDNTTTIQNAPPLKKPLTPTEIQEATKPLAVDTLPQKNEQKQQITTKPVPKIETPPKEEKMAETKPTTPSLEKIDKNQSPTKTITQAKEPPLATPKETPITTEKEPTKEIAKEIFQNQPEKTEKPTEQTTQITNNMVVQALQKIDESLTKRDLAAYRQLLAPSVDVGEIKGGGRTKMQTLTAEAYSKQLEQVLLRVAHYELKHVDPNIIIDNEKSQASVTSEVHVRLEFQDALETHKTYGEITTFNLVDEKLLLSRLAVGANLPKLASQTSEQTAAVTQINKMVDFCKTVSEIPETECHSLLEIYETTNGTKWKNQKNWLKTKQLCQWAGVTCVNNHVVTLKLDKNQLLGTVPNLSGLTALKVLNLSRNELSGAFPSFNALLELEVLSLGNNKLNGRLPDLSHLKLLRILELNKNQLTGNLPLFDNFAELEEVNLSDNQFVGEIPSLKKMNKLQKFALYNNQLTGNLPALDQLVSLKSMHLSGNHLVGQIPDMSNLLPLESLNLSVNQLSGTLPIGLSKLVNLKWLQLESNQLSGKIPDLRDLPKLSILKLQNNQLCGEIPDGLRLSGLKEANSELQIENNHLTATNKGLLSFLESKTPNWQTTQKPQTCE
jgi:hypothetical protein